MTTLTSKQKYRKGCDNMKMSFDEYIKNPMGTKTAVFTQREALRSVYVDKFDKVLLREMGNIEHKLFKKDDEYIAYFKIPSEKIAKFYYDVIIEFIPSSIVSKVKTTISGYNIKVFSNDPAFIFTYAYVFNKNNMIIDDLKDKIGKTALEEKPNIKNPKQVIGYVKSLYFAYLYMKNKGLFQKAVFDTYAIKYSKTLLYKSVMAASRKINERIEAQRSITKKDIKNKEEEIDAYNKSREKTKSPSSPIKKVKIVAKTKTVPKVKKSKVIKRHK